MLAGSAIVNVILVQRLKLQRNPEIELPQHRNRSYSRTPGHSQAHILLIFLGSSSAHRPMLEENFVARDHQ